MTTITIVGKHPNPAYDKPLTTKINPGVRICVTKFSKICENKKC